MNGITTLQYSMYYIVYIPINKYLLRLLFNMSQNISPSWINRYALASIVHGTDVSCKSIFGDVLFLLNL